MLYLSGCISELPNALKNYVSGMYDIIVINDVQRNGKTEKYLNLRDKVLNMSHYYFTNILPITVNFMLDCRTIMKEF